MNHKSLGELKYEDGHWLGEAKLPAFAAVSQRSPEPDTFGEADARKLASDLSRTLDGVKSRMKAKYGDAFTKMIEAARAAEPPIETYVPDRAADALGHDSTERSRQKAARIARGGFPVHILDPHRRGPTAEQEAAIRHLLAEADKVFQAVQRECFKSYQDMDGYSQEAAKSPADLGQYAVERVEIYREHRNGSSYLVFPLSAAWQDDRDLLVVYHPGKSAVWAFVDEALDELIESDEPVDDE